MENKLNKQSRLRSKQLLLVFLLGLIALDTYSVTGNIYSSHSKNPHHLIYSLTALLIIISIVAWAYMIIKKEESELNENRSNNSNYKARIKRRLLYRALKRQKISVH